MRARGVAVALAIGLVAGAAAMVAPVTVPAQAMQAEAAGATDEPAYPIRWLALGDSYSSGEGVNENYGHCAQSPAAYAQVAYDELDLGSGFPVEEPEFLACSGAQIPDVTQSVDLVEQIEQASGRYDLITLTIGGNDAGFGDLMEDCIIVSCSDGELLERYEARIAGQIDAVQPSLVDIYGRLVDELLAPGGHIIVLGYPRLFEASSSWPWYVFDGCETIRKNEADMIRRLADHANAMIADAVAQYPDDIHFLDVADTFEGHNLCSGWGTTNEWINGISVGWDDTNRFPGRYMHSFHPNRDGHAAEGQLLAETIRSLDWSLLSTASITLRYHALTVERGQQDVTFDIAAPPEPIDADIVDTLSTVLGEPLLDSSGADVPSPCGGFDRWVMWGPEKRPALGILIRHHGEVEELAGFRTYASSPYLTMADGVSVGAPASWLYAEYLDSVDVDITGPGPFGGVLVELRGGRPRGPEHVELAGRDPQDELVARGSGEQCALLADPY